MGRKNVAASTDATSQAELQVKTITQIVTSLVEEYKKGKDVNLTRIKNDVARKNGLKSVPKLVDIIAAIPEAHKKTILPYIKAKPVRTASGVRARVLSCSWRLFLAQQICVVAVMCKPHRCPHIAMTGNICVYCPGFVLRCFVVDTADGELCQRA